jgi:hypothetical protein
VPAVQCLDEIRKSTSHQYSEFSVAHLSSFHVEGIVDILLASKGVRDEESGFGGLIGIKKFWSVTLRSGDGKKRVECLFKKME